MKMREMTFKSFSKLLNDNGWKPNRKSGSHVSFIKEGEKNIITIIEGHKEISRPLAKRLLKEANLLHLVYEK